MYFLNNDVSVSSKTGVLTEHLTFSFTQQGEVTELRPIGELSEQNANCGGGDNGHGNFIPQNSKCLLFIISVNDIAPLKIGFYKVPVVK